MNVSPVHHGGVLTGSINPGTEPCHALFHGHTFPNREGPVYRVQFKVSVSSTVVVDVCPGKEARIGGDIPFPFLLQELELCWSILLDRCGSDGTWAGWDTAECLDFSGVRASWRGHIPGGNGKGAPGRITTAVIDGKDFWPETFGPTWTPATLKVLSGLRQAPHLVNPGYKGGGRFLFRWQSLDCAPLDHGEEGLGKFYPSFWPRWYVRCGVLHPGQELWQLVGLHSLPRVEYVGPQAGHPERQDRWSG